MHEMSVALNIIDIASEHALRNDAGRVISVHLEIGKLSGIEIAPLLNAFNIAKKGTILADSTANVTQVSPKATCKDCHTEFEFQDFFSCPYCNGNSIEIIAGEELRIVSLDVN